MRNNGNSQLESIERSTDTPQRSRSKMTAQKVLADFKQENAKLKEDNKNYLSKIEELESEVKALQEKLQLKENLWIQFMSEIESKKAAEQGINHTSGVNNKVISK